MGAAKIIGLIGFGLQGNLQGGAIVTRDPARGYVPSQSPSARLRDLPERAYGPPISTCSLRPPVIPRQSAAGRRWRKCLIVNCQGE